VSIVVKVPPWGLKHMVKGRFILIRKTKVLVRKRSVDLALVMIGGFCREEEYAPHILYSWARDAL
jgi:hypothetical protein